MFITGFLVGSVLGTALCLTVAVAQMLADDEARRQAALGPALVRLQTPVMGPSSLN
jgi:hypothetical protein